MHDLCDINIQSNDDFVKFVSVKKLLNHGLNYSDVILGYSCTTQ